MGDPGVSRRGETQPGTGSALRSTCGTPVPRRPRWPRGTRKEGLQATTRRNCRPKHDANANPAHWHARGGFCSDGEERFLLLFVFFRPGPAMGTRQTPRRRVSAGLYFLSSAAVSGQVPGRRCGGDGGWPHQPLAALRYQTRMMDRHFEACMKDKRSLGHRCDGPESRVYCSVHSPRPSRGSRGALREIMAVMMRAQDARRKARGRQPGLSARLVPCCGPGRPG